MSWAAIAQIESGRRKDVRLSSLAALASALGVTIDELTTGQGAASDDLVHRALLYDGEDDFVEAAVPYLSEGVTGHEHPLAVTTERAIKALKSRLGRQAAKVQFADSAQWYQSPTAALTSYRDYLNDKLASATGVIRILGEPVWTGRSAAAVKAWARYESLINIVFAGSPALLLCPYDVRSTAPAIIKGARQTHPEVVSGGAFAGSATYMNPEGFLLAH